MRNLHRNNSLNMRHLTRLTAQSPAYICGNSLQKATQLNLECKMPENRQMKYCIQNFPIGNLRLEVAENCLTHIIYTDLPPTSNEISDEILSGTILQLNEYFAGTRKKFDLPLAPAGSDF